MINDIGRDIDVTCIFHLRWVELEKMPCGIWSECLNSAGYEVVGPPSHRDEKAPNDCLRVSIYIFCKITLIWRESQK